MATLHLGSLRDRTSEFKAIAERLQKQQKQGEATSSGATESGALPSTKQVVQQKSEFAKKASDIGLGIHKTSAKLQKLANLARRTSMFDDPAQEIAELTGVIKQDIQGLNGAIAELQNVSAKQRDGNTHSQHHSTTIVDNLRTRLKDATKEFKDVLTLRTDNLKGQKDRQQLFSSKPSNGFGDTEPLLGLPPSGPGRSARALFGGEPDLANGASNAGASGAGFTYGHSRGVVHSSYDPYAGSQQGVIRSRSHANGTPAGSQQQQQQQQQAQLAAPQDTYLASRNEALQNVESTIVELGGIFQQLAHMVAEQGEMAVRIDENIDETLTNVGSAQTQLLKYLNSISSNRWLIMKVFFVLMIFLVVFVVFIA